MIGASAGTAAAQNNLVETVCCNSKQTGKILAGGGFWSRCQSAQAEAAACRQGSLPKQLKRQTPRMVSVTLESFIKHAAANLDV